MAYKSRPRAELSQEHYEAIGRVAVQWARVELSTITALEALLQTDKANAIVTFWHMGYNDRRDRLVSLVDLTEPDAGVAREFSTLITRLDTAYQIRNTMAHSTWVQGDTPGTITPLVIRAKGGPVKIGGHNLKEEQYTAKRIKGEAEKIQRLLEDFREFFRTRFGAVFSAAERSAKQDCD